MMHIRVGYLSGDQFRFAAQALTPVGGLLHSSDPCGCGDIINKNHLTLKLTLPLTITLTLTVTITLIPTVTITLTCDHNPDPSTLPVSDQ